MTGVRIAGALRRRMTRPPAAAPGATGAAVLGPLDVALAGAWFGAVVGLAELLDVVARRWLTGTITQETLRTNWHYAWMIPTANLCLLGALGVGFGLAARAWPRARADRAALFAFAGLAGLAAALGVPGLYGFARTALAAGVAVRGGAALARHAAGFRRVVRWTLPPAAGAVLALAAWQGTAVAWSEARARAGLPRPPAGAPNVLLVVLDTVRADALSPYGSARDTTPNLARLARQGVRFDEARATAPWTLPSHASLFTGRWRHELAVDVGVPLDRDAPTLAEYLASRGYDTAGFVANTPNCNAWYGFSRGFARYEDYYENAAASPVEVLRSARLGREVLKSSTARRAIKAVVATPRYFYRKSAAMINRDALAWLSRRGDDARPYFLFLNYFDVHDPYVPPPGAPRPFSQGPPRDVLSAARDAYDDCLAYLDAHLGDLFGELGRRGALRDTVVVITSDHGEGFGEHGLSGHGVSLYRQELHVPLLVLGPGRVPSGRVVADPVSLRDVPATVVSLAGLAAGAPFPGRSLARTWVESPAPPDPVLAEVRHAVPGLPDPAVAPASKGRMRSLVTEDHVYILNGDGREQLFDRRADPHETHDLAASPTSLDHLRRLRSRLDSLTTAEGPGS